MGGVKVVGLRRYPVKSLGGEALDWAELIPGRGVACDRRWGLAVVSDWTPLPEGGAESWRPWNFCLSLKRTAALAELRAAVAEADAEFPVLEISAAAGGRARGRPGMESERSGLENFLRRELRDARVRLMESESLPLWDERGVALSVLNLASVRELSGRMGLGPDGEKGGGSGVGGLSAERFRANLILDGAPAWAEMEWLGRDFVLRNAAGERGAVLRFASPTPRCAATRVNPQTGVRDLNVPAALVSHYGHSDLGIYGEIAARGAAGVGDEILPAA